MYQSEPAAAKQSWHQAAKRSGVAKRKYLVNGIKQNRRRIGEMKQHQRHQTSHGVAASAKAARRIGVAW